MGSAVPNLASSGFPGLGFADPRTGCDAAVHVHEADGVELLVAGEAAAALAGDGAGGIVAAVRMAALAPGVVGEALQHGAALVGDDRDGAEMVLVEVARGDGLVAVLDVHADDAAAAPIRVGIQCRLTPPGFPRATLISPNDLVEVAPARLLGKSPYATPISCCGTLTDTFYASSEEC